MDIMLDCEYEDYCNLLNRYFAICKNKNILEIAPGGGWHSKLILAQCPTELTVVEPNKNANSQLTKLNIDNIVNDDIFHYLQTKQSFDVVVCNGLLYHLHSPIYLLELITNMVSPEYLILESTHQENFHITNEIDNIPGYRHVDINWQSCKINLLIPNNYYMIMMTNLGYELIQTDSIKYPTILGGSKCNNWIGLWKKVK